MQIQSPPGLAGKYASREAAFTPALEDVLWQLQELRVSLFAQHVGTDGPVSEQRIQRALDEAAKPR